MKIYQLESQFTFGKFSGKKMSDVLVEQPSYISWCLINLDHFLIWSDTLSQILVACPNFKLSIEAQAALVKKTDEYFEEQDNANDRYEESRSNRLNRLDPTDYTHYNDDLDPDQQSEEFWNQF